jgi:hypothetical protein
MGLYLMCNYRRKNALCFDIEEVPEALGSEFGASLVFWPFTVTVSFKNAKGNC